MSLETHLRGLIERERAAGVVYLELSSLETLLDSWCRPSPPAGLWLRFRCGHEQEIGPQDDLASFLENARDWPCDACARRLARAAQDQRFAVTK